MLILVTGVSGSGKSEYAESMCCQLADGQTKYYIATMKPFGTEGAERVKRHHNLRQGKGFVTIEQYQNVSEAVGIIDGVSNVDNKDKKATVNESDIEIIKYTHDSSKPVVLLECMSNLLANECFEDGGNPDNIVDDCMKLYDSCSHLVIVTNEVFSDGCEYDEVTTDYIKRLGNINTQLAAMADIVVEVVYSIPVIHKGEELCHVLNH